MCGCVLTHRLLETTLDLRNWEDFMRRLLLILPFIGLLWLPFYNKADPQLWGFPFFYWYQFIWVFVTSILIWIVYQGEKNASGERKA
jgi:Protein of unknown function (DUF3311)